MASGMTRDQCRALLKEMCQHNGLPQTDSDIDRLILEAEDRGKTYDDLVGKVRRALRKTPGQQQQQELQHLPALSTSSAGKAVDEEGELNAYVGMVKEFCASRSMPFMQESVVTTFRTGRSKGASFSEIYDAMTQIPDPGKHPATTSTPHSQGPSVPKTRIEDKGSSIPCPPPGISSNDYNFWMEHMIKFVEQHPKLATSLANVDRRAKDPPVIVSEEQIAEMMKSCRERAQPYVALYHRFCDRFGDPEKEKAAVPAKDPRNVEKQTGLQKEGVRKQQTRAAAEVESIDSFGALCAPDISRGASRALELGTYPPLDSSMDVRTQCFRRIRRFCLYHSLAQSDAQIERMMRETLEHGQTLEGLMERLVKKYGPEPLDPEAGAVHRAAEFQRSKERLLRYLMHYDLEASPETAEEMLRRTESKGKSFEYLFSRLVRRFGPEPPQSAEDSELKKLRAAGPSSDERPAALLLSPRELAERRLIAFARHYGWQRDRRQLVKMLDDALARDPVNGITKLFDHLVVAWGPEPPLPEPIQQQLEQHQSIRTAFAARRQDTTEGYSADRDAPGVAAFTVRSASPKVEQPTRELPKDKRNAVKQLLLEYCRFHKIERTDSECDKILDDFEVVGWDEMFRKVIAKYGPPPWPQRDLDNALCRAPIDKASVMSEATSRSFAAAENHKMKMLSQYNAAFQIGWTDEEMRRMIDAVSGTDSDGPSFLDLLLSLERKYGPLPSSAPRETLDTRGVDKILGRLGLVRSSGGTIQTTREEESTKIFWRDRIRALLNFYLPGESFTLNDIDVLFAHFEREHASAGDGDPNLTMDEKYNKFWTLLLKKYGPEPAFLPAPPGSPSSILADPLRRYWYLKFKHYCDYYRIEKSPRELERMLDSYKERGWAFMFDKLVELHGPEPPIPVIAAQQSIGHGAPREVLPPSEWRRKLRHYCAAVFPTRPPSEIESYIDCFEEAQGPESLESLFSTLVLLHGPVPSAVAQPSHRELPPPSPQPASQVADPSNYVVPSLRIILTLDGFDFGLYEVSSPHVRQRVCRAIESDVASCIHIGSNLVDVRELTSYGSLVQVDLLLDSARIGPDPRKLGDELIRYVCAGAFPVRSIRQSYIEDLGGNPLNLRAISAAIAEIRSTPDFAFSSSLLTSPSFMAVNPNDTPRATPVQPPDKAIVGQGVHLSSTRHSASFSGDESARRPRGSSQPYSTGNVKELPGSSSHGSYFSAPWASVTHSANPPTPLSGGWAMSRSAIEEQHQETNEASPEVRRSIQKPLFTAPTDATPPMRQTSPLSAVAFSLRSQRLRGGTPTWD